MVIVKITDTQTGKEKEWRGNYVMGFVAKHDEVFGSSCESFGMGRIDKKVATTLLKRHYKEMLKVTKRR